MEGKIKIGDSYYPTPKQTAIEKDYQSNTVNSIYRITSYYEEQALTALNTNLAYTCACPVSSLKPWITVVKVDVNFWFLDSGAGTYLINNKGHIIWNPLINQDGNNIVRSSNFHIDQFIQVSLNNQILGFVLGVSGADVLQATGITPGAGDLMRLFVSVTYF